MIITLKCASCGSNLEINPETDVFACGYCGASQMVKRSGGTISLKLLTNSISKVQIGTDKTAAELAIVRLKEELNLNRNHYSQFYKAKQNLWKTYNNIFAVFYIAVFVLTFVAIGNASPIAALIVSVVLAIGVAFLHVVAYRANKRKYEPRFTALDNEYQNLQNRLIAQKRIVNR